MGISLAPSTAEPAMQASVRQVLDLVQQGDAGALAEVYKAHGNLVFQTALRLTGRRADAEDVTQDVFLRLPGAVGGFTGLAPSFPGWIRKVAVRQALMHLRSGKRRREVDIESAGAVFGRADGVVERMTIAAALERLTPEHRTVFLLKEVEGYDHSEIAEAMGISTANSEVRLHRARKELRALLRGSV